jgi:iron complex transport system ATP-binding protein
MRILNVENLCFSYGSNEVLKGIYMEFYQGTFYGIIGPNGCGKSTLLKNLYGYLSPAEGSISIYDKDIHKLKARQRAKYIAYVPQETNTGFDFSVYDVIAMGRNPYHSGLQALTKEDHDIIMEAMEETSTLHLKDKSINELSGGEKQRTILARAFAQDSEIILMDEPVSMLDINHQVEIMDLAKSLADRKYKTIICVLHDLNLAAQYTHHIFLMKDGKLIEAGMQDEVLTEDILTDVYGVSVRVREDEDSKIKTIIPLSRL